MNDAHLHLVLTHLPIVLAPTGLIFLAVAMLRRSRELTTAALVLLFIGGVSVVGPYWTGEGAEHVVEWLPDVSSRFIERHEEAAEFALVAMLVLAGLSVAALVVVRRAPRFGAASCGLVLAAACVAVAATLRTAQLGGLIRHSEIREGALVVRAPVEAHADADDD